MTAATLVAVLLNVTIVMTIALAAARFARGSRAAVRHVLIAAAFAALLILPVASITVPTFNVALPIATEKLPAPVADALEATRTVSSVEDAAGAAVKAPPSAPGLSWLSLVLAAWFAGAVVFFTPVLVGLWQVRSLRRVSLPWQDGQPLVDRLAASAGIRRRVRVLLHESLPGPMTCGVADPAVILPIDATSWSAEDLHRAIVHELEHVRRRDWVSQCLARAISAFYWFHPIVWAAWRQLALEAERACDDAVLKASEATAYADQLVNLAQKLTTASKVPQLAMANRHDLSARVVSVLDARQPRGRAGVVVVGAVVAMTAVLAMGMSSIRLVAFQTAQTPAPSGPKPKYDTASIKPCEAEENPTGARGTAGGTNATFSPGRFFVPCVTTGQLIYLAYAAYGVPVDQHLVNDDSGEAANDTKVRGGPSWVHSLREKYLIEATAAGATERTVLMGTMLQSLLEDRFHLKIHRDTEQVGMLTLTIGKPGFKLKPMKEGDCVAYDPSMTPADMIAKPVCGNLNMTQENGDTVWRFGAGTIPGLAGQLGRVLKTHILDNTAIADKFNFTFKFHRGADAFETESSVTHALEEQLGLKLDKTKGPRGFLVIEAIERPTPDGPFVFVPAPARAQGAGQRRR